MGAVAGLISFIPYVGAVVGGVLAIGLALFQFWGDWVWIVAVWAIFQSGQFLEGNIPHPPKARGLERRPAPRVAHLRAVGLRRAFRLRRPARRRPGGCGRGRRARFLITQYRQSLLYRGLDGRSEAARETDDV